MALIYMSPDPYHEAFEEIMDIRHLDYNHHCTAGLCLAHTNGCLILGGMAPSTPAAKIPRWRSHIKGAWLIKISNHAVSTIAQAQQVFAQLNADGASSVTLLFLHPEICQDISHDSLPIISSAPFSQHVHDQMNHHWDFSTVADYLWKAPPYKTVDSGDVLNYVTRMMRLTRGKLLQQDDWSDWQDSEYFQLDQNDHAQGMFGDPITMTKANVVFHLVWTYVINAVDGRKKARCVCDGSTRSGMVHILDETYASCVDQTSSHLFYAVSATKNLLVFGADVSNAFAEAPPPRQGFFVCPDRAFHEWWVNHKKRPPILDGHVIPILSAMQGHPESPRLRENTPTQFYANSGLLRPSMSHVYTPELSTTTMSSSNVRSTTSPLLLRMPKLLMSYSTSSQDQQIDLLD